MKLFFTISIAVVLLLVLSVLPGIADAGHVCRNKDCSDIVGEYLVKDNRGSSRRLVDNHHEVMREEARKRRIDILRREKASM
jgi:hypothetical protein